MVADYYNMPLVFEDCNSKYFEGELPLPEFNLLSSSTTCGYIEWTNGGWGDNNIYDPVISMTDYYDFTESQYIDIMCHEMIHYYLALYGIDRKGSHGKAFKKMAEELNLNYGLHITKRLELSQYKKNSNRGKRKGRVVRTSNQPQQNTRFYQEFDGIVWEFNGFGEYIGFLFGRFVGTIIFGILLFFLLCYFYYLGTGHWPDLTPLWNLLKKLVT